MMAVVVYFVGVTVCTGCIAGCGQMHVAFRFACIGCAVENTLVSTCQHLSACHCNIKMLVTLPGHHQNVQ